MAEERGIPWSELGGTLQNDILKEFHSQNEFIFPPEASVKLVVDTIEFASQHLPRWNSVSISGYHIREAGSTATQELAFTLRDGMEYVEACMRRGMPVDAFAPRLSFFFNAHIDFFEEIAKYRALRRLWARMLKERYGAKDPRSMMLRTHTQTGGSTLMAQQPENNIVRAAIQSLAAVIGGVQSIALSCFDEALALPTDDAQRIALRTQQVIAHETGVTDTVDPMAGSYFVESLTNDLERAAQEYLDQIEGMGGSVTAIETGWMQNQIAEASWKYQQEVDEKREIVVGVNDYAEGAEQPQSIFSVDKRLVEHQLGRLRHHRTERNQQQVASTLAALRAAAQGDTNLMPPILDAVKAYATLGQICGALREVFGEYRPVTVI